MEKIGIAEKLYNLIHEPTELLEKELQSRGIEKGEEEGGKRKRGKKMARKAVGKGDWEYDPK